MPNQTELVQCYIRVTDLLRISRSQAAREVGRSATTGSRWAGGDVREYNGSVARAILKRLSEVASMQPMQPAEVEAKRLATEMVKRVQREGVTLDRKAKTPELGAADALADERQAEAEEARRRQGRPKRYRGGNADDS